MSRIKTTPVALLFAALGLAPYFFICFYSLPFSDDFCSAWTASESNSFIDKFLNEYLKWSGRFTSDALENFNPLITGKVLYYQFTICLSLLSIPLVFYFFIHQLIRDRAVSLLCSLILSLFFLCYQPNITEGVYWFMGIITYLMGNLTFLLQLTLLLKSAESDGKVKALLIPCSLLLLVISIGFNEVGALLIPLFYLGAIIFGKSVATERTTNRKILWIHFVLAVIASAFLFFAPGNFMRENVFEDRYNLPHSLFYASLQTIRFIGKWILSVPFILLSLVLVTMADQVQNKFLKLIDYRIILGFLLLTVFSASFLPYFATGILGQHRTMNYVFFYFLLLWILLLISISEKNLLAQKFSWLKNGKVILLLVLASLFSLGITGNGLKIIRDLSHDNYRKYEAAFFDRQQVIIQNTEKPIQPLRIIPEVFTITDTKTDTAWWVDKCMKKFYSETDIVLR